MGRVHERIDGKIRAFIEAQKMFFVATAPLSADGRVNLSPKGYDSFRILDETTVAYLDLGGSGIETVAHARENGRITLMFMAMDGAPNVLRLSGRAQVAQFDDPGFDELMALFPDFVRARNIVKVRLTRISDSCGWGIPHYEYKGDRGQLKRWVSHKDDGEWRERRYVSNALSIDGLPGLVRPTSPKAAD